MISKFNGVHENMDEKRGRGVHNSYGCWDMMKLAHPHTDVHTHTHTHTHTYPFC